MTHVLKVVTVISMHDVMDYWTQKGFVIFTCFPDSFRSCWNIKFCGLDLAWIVYDVNHRIPILKQVYKPPPAQPTFTEEMNAKYHLSTMRIILWLTIALDIGDFSMPSADGTLPSKLTSKDSSAKTLPQVGWSWTRQSLRTRRRWWQTRSTGQWRTASWSDWPARLGLR